MRIEFTMEGGLAFMPGLAGPVAIEADRLPEAAAREIRDLVASTRFFERPAEAGALAPGAADYRQYTITIAQDGNRRTLRVTEPIQDPDLRRLVRLIETEARAIRRHGQSGAGQPR